MAETTRPDPYAVLGVPRDALEDEIRAAYRRLVRSEHPDKGGSHERFMMVTWAYEMLTVPEGRAASDAAGATLDGTEPNWEAHETEWDRGPSHPVPSHTVLDFGTVTAGGLSRALRFDVSYEADPPEVDYQPRVGRWWTTDALAVDDPMAAIEIEVMSPLRRVHPAATSATGSWSPLTMPTPPRSKSGARWLAGRPPRQSPAHLLSPRRPQPDLPPEWRSQWHHPCQPLGVRRLDTVMNRHSAAGSR
jgi:hypothetical protein